MFEALERALCGISSLVSGGDVDGVCQLRAPIDETTLVTTNDSLLTMFRVIGSRRHIGSEEFDRQAEALVTALVPMLKSGQAGRQHSVLAGFRSSPKNGADVLKHILMPSIATARRLKADVGFLFQDRLAAMAPACVDEIIVFGVMTHTTGLSPSDLARWKESRAKQSALRAKAGFVLDDSVSQTPVGPPSVMMSRHAAAVATLIGKLGDEGGGVKIMLDKLSCHEAIGVMRRYLDASSFDPDWRPHLLGDRSGMIADRRASRTLDHGLPVRISRQVITESLRESFADAEIVKRGRMYYASVSLDVCPQELPTPSFAELSSSIGNLIPWQVNFDLSPNGLDFNRMERAFSSMVGSAGDHNKAIKRAFDQLSDMKTAGVYITALRAVFTTWSDSEAKCVDNVSFLKSKVEGWGQAVATNESGAPAHIFAASAPGFARSIPAPYLPAPIDAVTRMLPLFRPASIWTSGQLVLFTREGRPYPINLGSSAQNFWGTLIFAPTGSGKSFLMNMLNAGVLFSPGLTELPMCTIIDKGPSAKGVVNLARALLPPELAAQVVYWRPTPTDASYCVNPFDTQLGCDRPLAADRDFLSALLGGIAPNLGPEGGKFIGHVIDVAYAYFERKSLTAKRWQWNTDLALSQKLASVGIAFEEDRPPRIWSVVDAFFRAGMIDEAAEAQFHAVPQMSDLTQILFDRRVMDIWGAAPSSTGETMVKVLERNLISASNEYKVFYGVTRHRASARFVVVDIEGMAAASTSEEGARRFGLMMLFARRLGARNFFLHPDDVRDVCPELYLSYQMARATKLKEDLKFLEYDEIHNAKGIGAVQNLLQKDAREGRKYNVVAILSSQDMGDFPEDLVKNSYNFFILGAGSAASSRQLQETFDLSDSERDVISAECTSPGKVFGMFRTNRGMLSQLLFTKPGPIEIWAFNTSATDMALRDALYERMGIKRALSFLASVFPGGSARPYIEDLRRTMKDNQVADDGMTEFVIARLQKRIEEFLQKH